MALSPEPKSFKSRQNGREEGLSERLVQMERVVWGTREKDYVDGLVHNMREITDLLRLLKRWGNRWGMILLGALMATGLIDGRAAHVIGQFLAGLH